MYIRLASAAISEGFGLEGGILLDESQTGERYKEGSGRRLDGLMPKDLCVLITLLGIVVHCGSPMNKELHYISTILQKGLEHRALGPHSFQKRKYQD